MHSASCTTKWYETQSWELSPPRDLKNPTGDHGPTIPHAQPDNFEGEKCPFLILSLKLSLKLSLRKGEGGRESRDPHVSVARYRDGNPNVAHPGGKQFAFGFASAPSAPPSASPTAQPVFILIPMHPKNIFYYFFLTIVVPPARPT